MTWRDRDSATARVARICGLVSITGRAISFLRHDLHDARLLVAYRAHVENFQSAMALLNHPVETAAIPYLSTHLKGHFFARHIGRAASDASAAVRLRLDGRIRMVRGAWGDAARLQRIHF